MQKSSINICKRILLFLILNALLLSCAGGIPVNISSMGQVNYTIEYPNGNTYQLSAVCGEDMCRYIVFDSLGMPVVNKEYSNGKFKNVKFLPPNKKYDNLFIYIINNRGNINQFEYKINNTAVIVYKNN